MTENEMGTVAKEIAETMITIYKARTTLDMSKETLNRLSGIIC